MMRDLLGPNSGRDTESLSVWTSSRHTESSICRIRGSAWFFIFAVIIVSSIGALEVVSAGLEFKQELVDETGAGFKTILEAAQKLSRAKEAEILFHSAGEAFKNIHAEAWFTALPRVQNPAFEAAKSVITLGETLSQAGEKFSNSYGRIQDFGSRLFEAQKVTAPVGEQARPSLTAELKKHFPAFEEIHRSMAKAASALRDVPVNFIPPALRERVEMGGATLSLLTNFMNTMQEDLPALLTLLGDERPHTILVLLQNNAELRPSGGFIGNYMIVKTNGGYITHSGVFDIYSADHQLNEKLQSPPEISPVSQRWFMRDANYSAHFPLSAEKVAWFLEKENGPRVDTVIAVDQWAAKEALRITGPIKIPELSSPLTAGNFSTIVSYVVEAKISGRADPKALFRNLIPAVQKILFTRTDPVSLMPTLEEGIVEKHLLAYSKDASVQSFFIRHGVAGLMKEVTQKEDYLEVVHTSIGGNKSDAYVSENLEHTSFIKEDGSVINELTISRTHNWNYAAERALLKTIREFGFPAKIDPDLSWILGRGTNKHMLRVYVPKGSLLESTTSDDLMTKQDTETGKTYFSLPISVDAGKTGSVTIRYRLPFKLDLDIADKYILTVQKQPGQTDLTLVKRIVPDAGVLMHANFPDTGFDDGTGAWKFETPLEGDASFTTVVGV